jgi:hypothetical protein
MGFVKVFAVVLSLLLSSIYFISSTNLELLSVTPYDIVTSHVTNIQILLGFRIFCLHVVMVTLYVVLTDPIGLVITVPGRGGVLKTVTLHGFERLSTFTVWSWTLIGIYFGLTSYCGIMNLIGREGDIPLIILQLSWILYELSFPISFLVTIIVTFVLIPPAKARGTHQPLFSTPSLLMHNANVVMMATENLLNIVPYSFSHAVFGVLYGLLYAVFAWGWYHHKGVFYYFFLDYEFKGAEFWYVGLILVVCSTSSPPLPSTECTVALHLPFSWSISISNGADS